MTKYNIFPCSDCLHKDTCTTRTLIMASMKASALGIEMGCIDYPEEIYDIEFKAVSLDFNCNGFEPTE